MNLGMGHSLTDDRVLQSKARAREDSLGRVGASGHVAGEFLQRGMVRQPGGGC